MLEKKVVAARYLLHRVHDGFPQGGILAFDIDRKCGGGRSTIYVAFNFPRGKNPFTRAACASSSGSFPASCMKWSSILQSMGLLDTGISSRCNLNRVASGPSAGAVSRLKTGGAREN